MRKKHVTFIMAAVITAALLTACGGTDQNAANGSDTQNGTNQNSAATNTDGQTGSQTGSGDTAAGVTEEQAKTTAFADAGVTEDQITGIRVKKDRDDGRQVYDVEFYSGNKEYDYEIDASTGEILSSDLDIENDFNQGGDDQSGQNPAVSKEEATAAALAKVQGAAEKDIRIKLDKDDGKLVYEGDIYYNNTEYEFEIDADTGDFLEWSEERK